MLRSSRNLRNGHRSVAHDVGKAATVSCESADSHAVLDYLKRQPWLFLLILLQAVTLFPFRFTDSFGERDSYRMFLGLIDTVKTGALFNSSLLFNREASFGYYGLLYALTPITGNTPLALISAMNWIGLLSVILFTIPNYIIIERLFGSRVAITSGLILIATPVWWHCGLYAHPISTSLLLFFAGMAVICRYTETPPIAVRAVALVLFAMALTFRFDVILLFIALIALLWQVRQGSFRRTAKEALSYIAGSIAFFSAAKACLPAITHGYAPPSLFALLARFEQTSNVVSSLRDSIVSLGQGFTPILLVAVPLSMWMLFRRAQYWLLLFVSGEIVVNLVFWFPNTVPPRHYLLMAPAVSISAALLVLKLMHLRSFRPSRLQCALAGSVFAVCIVLTSLAFNLGKGRLSYFPSQFTERLTMKGKIAEADYIAEKLVRLAPLKSPVAVLCDSNLVLAKMEELAPDTTAVFKFTPALPHPVGVHEVREGGNRFVMVEQSWEPAEIKSFDRSTEYTSVPVLSARYLSITYTGPRPQIRDAGDGQSSARE